MSTEVVLFVTLGLISVAAAVGMLLSENPVHSALFLVLNFGCVAVLYLLLDAPFLAMVQIAVYAGAIMVLFLFVIMLLGAEGGEVSEVPQYKWMTPATLVLTIALLIASSVAFFQGEIDTQEPPAPLPLVRIAHAASDFPDADIYANGELLAAGLNFGDSTRYLTVEPGSYALSVAVAGDDPALALPLGNITLEGGTAQTVVAYGEGLLPSLAVIPQDLSEIRRAGRLTVFNGFTGETSLDILDVGSDYRIDPDETITTIASELSPGEILDLGEFRNSPVGWVVTRTGSTGEFLLRLRPLDIEYGNNHLVILSGERDGIDATVLRLVPVAVVSGTLPSFGSPRAVGGLLFVEYVLPLQIVAILLLAAMVGAIVLTQRGAARPKPGRPTRRKVSRPLTSVIASQTGHDVTESYPALEPETAQPTGEASGD